MNPLAHPAADSTKAAVTRALSSRGGRLRRWARRQPAITRDAVLLRRTARDGRVGYLGFAGQQNLGDDAIRDAHVRWTLGRPVLELPVHHTRSVLARAGSGTRPRPVLLGGGTLVGRPDWLTRVELYRDHGWASSWGMLGAGVEDPEFSGKAQHATWDDLRRWARVLPAFGDVTVRGPLSRDLLSEVGVPARIVGDPALLFQDPIPSTDVDERLIGMSVAVPEDVWGGEPGAVVDALTTAAKQLVAEGYRIRLVALAPADVAPSAAVAAGIGDDRSVEVLRPADTDELVRQLRPCAAVVGQRLHAVVLAAAAHVPALAIEYRPKCLDFQLSIGQGEQTVSTRGITPSTVVERTLALVRDRDRHQEAVTRGVTPLVEELRRSSASLREQLGLS